MPRTSLAFERDRRRDRRLMMLGYRVARFTWRDIEQRPEEVTRTVTALRYGGRSRERCHGAEPDLYAPRVGETRRR